MLRSRLFSALLAVSAAAAFTILPGCGGGDSKPTPPPPGPGSSGGASDKGSGKALEELASKGTGTVEGKIVFDGNPPVPKALEMSKDTDHCKKSPNEDEKTDPTWRVSDGGGVFNVFVWVQAPAGKYFKLTEKDQGKAGTVVVKQPFCAFEPHVFAIYPSYYDAATKKQKRTGQTLRVINDATIAHNSNVGFGNAKLNTGKNELLPPKSEGQEPKGIDFADVKVSKDNEAGKVETITIGCNVHTWMNAKGRAFDHPFYAITKDGSFRIENVPAGTELDVMYWHESMAEPKVLEKVKIEDGKVAKTKELKIK